MNTVLQYRLMADQVNQLNRLITWDQDQKVKGAKLPNGISW